MSLVLVADDQPATRENLVRAIQGAGHKVITAIDGQDCLEKVALERPDLVVLDVVMPRIGGLEVCRALKRDPLEYVPVMFVSGRSDAQSKAQGLRAGADDYMAKPYDPDELRARIENLLRIRKLVEGAKPPSPTPSSPDETGEKDALTGVANQQFLTQRLAHEFERAEKGLDPLSIMAIDLDSFTDVNSRYGRGAGDRLLVACARSLARACAERDLVARAGGDEFVLLLPGVHFSACVSLAERMWREIQATTIEEAGFKIRAAASIGVSSYPSRDVASPKDLLRFAHAALARAKSEGRGRICLYQHQGYLFQPQ